ncbi:hypothetical protein V6N13_020363 [Hibiscus sabdariffa]
MARNKVKLAYITNHAARKATYHKRKKDLVKKVSELSTLCGVEACVVIYPPACDSQPKVWSSTATTHCMLSNFRTLFVLEQSNRMMTQESLVRQRIAKVEERLEIAREKSQNEIDSNHVAKSWWKGFEHCEEVGFE